MARPFAHHYHRRACSTQPRTSVDNLTGYSPAQVAVAYGFRPLATADITIGVVELGGQYYPSDMQAFCNQFSLTPPLVTIIPVNNATITPDPNGADVEVALDVQVIAGASPGIKLRLYFCDNTEAGFIAGVQQAVNECDLVSVSWGAPEDQWTASGRATLNTVMAKRPVFIASGDSGSSDGEKGLHVDFPASAPYAVACGGTTLPPATKPPLLSGMPDITQETGWSDGGGGISSVFPRPVYQINTMPSATMRGSPDLAGCADPNTPYLVIANGQWQQVGGTSAVAPLMAACFGILKAANGGYLPLDVHPLIYAAGSCRDITAGTNGAYQASVGYDLVTGMGVPKYPALLQTLRSMTPPTTPTPAPPPTPSPAPSPPPSPPPVPSPPSPPTPSPVGPIPMPPTQPPSSVLEKLVQQIVDQLFANLEQTFGNNPLETAILENLKQFVDSQLPVIFGNLEQTLLGYVQSRLEAVFSQWEGKAVHDPFLSLGHTAVLSRLRTGMRALPPGTIVTGILTLLQAAPQILGLIQGILQMIQGIKGGQGSAG